MLTSITLFLSRQWVSNSAITGAEVKILIIRLPLIRPLCGIPLKVFWVKTKVPDKSTFFLIPTFNLSYCNEYLGIRYSNFHRAKSLSFRIVRGMIKSKSMQFWMKFYVVSILVNTCWLIMNFCKFWASHVWDFHLKCHEMFYSEFHFEPSKFSTDFHVVNNSVNKCWLIQNSFII